MRMTILQDQNIKKANKKKLYTKDDVIDEMRALNTRLRDKLKELNSRMERILDNVKYRIILDQKNREKQPETSEHKSKALEMEIKALKKQNEMSITEVTHLNYKLQETIGYDKIFEIKELINKEKINNKFFK